MKLHLYQDDFRDLIVLTSQFKKLPEAVIRRDYLIVMLLKNLISSSYADYCVFKGGTSLSKCYPQSIERFSEDIDLTYLNQDESDKVISKNIKKIEQIMVSELCYLPINEERSKRSKSAYIWLNDETDKIKIEIGSRIKPTPYHVRCIKTYIQEYLEHHQLDGEIEKFELSTIKVNVLDITRTFIDKIMAVKRHALSDTLKHKVRHIYDVVCLFQMDDIQALLSDKQMLKKLVIDTKEADCFYFEKKQVCKSHERYHFSSWYHLFDTQMVKQAYEKLHLSLLYTPTQQKFSLAIKIFKEIAAILDSIEE